MSDSPIPKQNETEGRNFLSMEEKEAFRFPDIDDLSSRLRFSPADGHIWLDERRMILLHTRSMGVLRREMIESFGMDRARMLLTRMGYESGSADAQLPAKIRSEKEVFDAFSVGPQLHALEGIVNVQPLKFEVNVEKGEFLAEYLWHNSFEDEIHIDTYGLGTEPVCWTQIGYACGFSTTFMGRPILFREVECRAMGHNQCRIIGKPVEEWGSEAEDDLSFLRAHDFVNRDITTAAPRHAASPAPASPIDDPDGTTDDRWEMVGASASFNIACHMLERVAETEATVLFLGESGVGKEMFANNLHRIGCRKDKPFVAVNCAAIPENLTESELFGVEKGAYTGATQSRSGRFERADGGTLFLDEVGTLSLSAQGKLLRALQEGEIERVGDTKVRKVNVRVVTATNVDLKHAVTAGKFREDLFYRLNVFPIHIPPLRERRADIPLLMNRFLNRFSRKHRKAITGFTERAIDGVLVYDWPGNIRELENCVERGVILAPADGPIDRCHLFVSGENVTGESLSLTGMGNLDRNAGVNEGPGLFDNNSATTGREFVSNGSEGSGAGRIAESALDNGMSFEDVESALLRAAVDKAGGNLSKAARALGLTRPQLAYRLSKLDEAP